MRAKRFSIFSGAYIALMLLLMYIPIALVMAYSFNVSRMSSIWTGFTLDWYVELFKDKSILRALENSLILGVLSSVGAAVIGTMAAVGIGGFRAKWTGVMEYFSIVPIMIPEIILGMVFLAFFALLGLPFGMLTLVIAHISFCTPYVYLLVKARMAGMDRSLVEAAKDLGASDARAFLDVTVPLALPAVASGMMLSFAMSFDDVIISAFVTGVDANTLPLKIYSQVKTGITPKTNALCTLMFLATVMLGALSALVGRPKTRRAGTKKRVGGVYLSRNDVMEGGLE
jgi:spermidine/putrescine transport system permease protein